MTKTKPDPLLLLALLRADGLPLPVPEYRFARNRKWRFDFAYPSHRIAIEIEGGIYIGGRHTRGGGYANDLEKYNAASFMGWTLFRFTHSQVSKGYATRYIRKYLTKKGITE